MARVSRKKQNAVQTQVDTSVRIWKTALYVRLSVEDNGKDSDSVENQTALLEEYVSNHPGLSKVAIFIDNGYTGTDFLRPEFNRMMEAVQAELIDCIVVKETFPVWGVITLRLLSLLKRFAHFTDCGL